MHVLTKVFIVLVSLMAVLLVPLVVVYATNEDSYKARYQEADAQKAQALEQMKTATARAAADMSAKEAEIADLRTANESLQKGKDAADLSARQLESQLAAAQATQAKIIADIATIRSTLEASQQLTETLVADNRTLRSNSVAIERQKVELDEALRDVTGQLEVAEQARRALQEELARLKDEHSKTLTQLGMAISQGFGTKNEARLGGISPDKNLTATIIRVERNSGQVLAEIDAGSRDGVKKDWNLAIGNDGNFIANLRIINVDINRATGIVTLESKDRGMVQVGYTAHAMAGQN